VVFPNFSGDGFEPSRTPYQEGRARSARRKPKVSEMGVGVRRNGSVSEWAI